MDIKMVNRVDDAEARDVTCVSRDTRRKKVTPVRKWEKEYRVCDIRFQKKISLILHFYIILHPFSSPAL